LISLISSHFKGVFTSILLLPEYSHKAVTNALKFLFMERAEKMSLTMSFSYLNAYLEQESLTLMFVALWLSNRRKRTCQNQNQRIFPALPLDHERHGFLNLTSIFVVLFPSLFIYYFDPADSLVWSFSILRIVHVAIGFPAVMLSVMYVFNDLPRPTQKWMRITAIL